MKINKESKAMYLCFMERNTLIALLEKKSESHDFNISMIRMIGIISKKRKSTFD